MVVVRAKDAKTRESPMVPNHCLGVHVEVNACLGAIASSSDLLGAFMAPCGVMQVFMAVACVSVFVNAVCVVNKCGQCSMCSVQEWWCRVSRQLLVGRRTSWAHCRSPPRGGPGALSMFVATKYLPKSNG